MNTVNDNMHNTEDFHIRLKSLIRPNRRQWCQVVGLGQSTVKLWEDGSYPRTDLITMVCSKLKISPNWLLMGIGDKNLSKTEKQSQEPEKKDTDISPATDSVGVTDIPPLLHKVESVGNTDVFEKIANMDDIADLRLMAKSILLMAKELERENEDLKKRWAEQVK